MGLDFQNKIKKSIFIDFDYLWRISVSTLKKI